MSENIFSLCSAVYCVVDAALLLCSKHFVAVRSPEACLTSHFLSAAKSKYEKPCTASSFIMQFRYLYENKLYFDIFFLSRSLPSIPSQEKHF